MTSFFPNDAISLRSNNFIFTSCLLFHQVGKKKSKDLLGTLLDDRLAVDRKPSRNRCGEVGGPVSARCMTMSFGLRTMRLLEEVLVSDEYYVSPSIEREILSDQTRT